MKANQNECYFLSSLGINIKFSLPACILENSDSQKCFGVTIDRRLNFNEYFINLCDKASKKYSSTRKNSRTYITNTKANFNECLFYVSVWLLSFSLAEPQ